VITDDVDVCCQVCDELWYDGEWVAAPPDWPGGQQILRCKCGSTSFSISRAVK
jgi:hypothetical protein